MLLILPTSILWYFYISTFCLFLLLTKLLLPQFEFPQCTPMFFSSVFFMRWSQKMIWKHLLKTINSRIPKDLCNQILTSKNWSINFSSMLGYIDFNKKRRFSIALLVENRVRKITCIAFLDIPRHRPVLCFS